ncbi:MAG: hypothetical protein WBG69_09850 [Arcobacteraceae bacterium]
MKSIMTVILLFSFSFSKECYFNKVDTVCYYKYFNRANIHKAKDSEEYYVNKNGSIYTFDKTIEVRFNSIGAVFTILSDFELEFIDKINNEIYLFNVQDKRDLFATISKLNRLKTVMKAEPHKQRKYTNSYIQRKLEAKRARFEAVMKEANEKIKNKDKPKIEKKVTTPVIKGTFLNPDEEK